MTYGTNNEYGFDYLRDNMKFDLEEMVQRPFHFAIVDEVDSILIDEARTPLIISGPTDDTSELYIAVDKIIPGLSPDDYEIDEKQKTVALTDAGNEHLEALLAEAGLLGGHGLYDMQNVSVVHHANQALRAHTLFRRDTDYIVKNNQVIIIDEFTGRMMEGRRYSDGLHQALEAKERVENPDRKPDRRVDHLPELFSHVSQAGRHDRHGDDRSGGIHRYLQVGSRRRADEPAGRPHR